MGRRRRRRGILQELRETTTEKNIEPFTGTDDVGKYVGHFDGLQRTNASSASRSAAHGANSLREWSPQRLREQRERFIATRESLIASMRQVKRRYRELKTSLPGESNSPARNKARHVLRGKMEAQYRPLLTELSMIEAQLLAVNHELRLRDVGAAGAISFSDQDPREDVLYLQNAYQLIVSLTHRLSQHYAVPSHSEKAVSLAIKMHLEKRLRQTKLTK